MHNLFNSINHFVRLAENVPFLKDKADDNDPSNQEAENIGKEPINSKKADFFSDLKSNLSNYHAAPSNFINSNDFNNDDDDDDFNINDVDIYDDVNINDDDDIDVNLNPEPNNPPPDDISVDDPYFSPSSSSSFKSDIADLPPHNLSDEFIIRKFLTNKL